MRPTGSSSLESATKIVRSGRAYWALSLYPTAGEAGGCVRFGLSRRSGGSGEWEEDPDRSASEAARRARGKLRRYGTANRLNRLGTLTYRGRGCHDPQQFRRDVGVFFRRLRRSLGGDPFPYMWVPEW